MLEIKNLEIKDILKNINLKFEEGTITSIIGKNGSGKTTLARAICSLVDYKGEIKSKGEKAFVFQNPDVQFVRSIVEDDIAFGLENMATSRKKIKSEIKKLSIEFNICDLLNKSVHKLSGGQKQKVAIVANLILNPNIIVLDEAFEMLDIKSKEEILIILKNYVANNEVILINITHDNKVLEYSDYIVGIDKQTIDFNLKQKDFFENRELINKYKVEVPFYIEVKNELKNNNIKCEEDLKGLL